jgi:hypothetical protein
MMESWSRLPRTLRAGLLIWMGMCLARLAVDRLEPQSSFVEAAIGALYQASFFGMLIGAFRCLPRLPAGGVGLRLAVAGLLGLVVMQFAMTAMFAYASVADDYERMEGAARIVGYLSLTIDIVGMVGWAIAARSIALGVGLVIASVGVFESGPILRHLMDDPSPARFELASALSELVQCLLTALAAARMAGRAPAVAVRRTGGLGDFATATWLAVAAITVVLFAAIALERDPHAADWSVIIAVTVGLIGALRLGLGGAALDDEGGATGWMAAGAAVFALGCAGMLLRMIPSMMEVSLRRYEHELYDIHDIFATVVIGVVGMMLALGAATGLARRLGAMPVAARLSAVLIAVVVLLGYGFLQILLLRREESSLVPLGLAGLAGIGAVIAAAVVFTHAANRLGGPQLPAATLRSP